MGKGSILGPIAQVAGLGLTVAGVPEVGLPLSEIGAAAQQGSSSTTTTYTDPTTPYRVTLPSGAVITMYAHGKGSETVTQNNPGLLSAGINAATQTYGALYGSTKTPYADANYPTPTAPKSLTYSAPKTSPGLDTSGLLSGLDSYDPNAYDPMLGR